MLPVVEIKSGRPDTKSAFQIALKDKHGKPCCLLERGLSIWRHPAEPIIEVGLLTLLFVLSVITEEGATRSKLRN